MRTYPDVEQRYPGGASVVQAPGFRWGAVFAGAFVALGLWVLLYSLGLAFGLTSVDPNDPNSIRGAGLGTGIWSLIAPLIALFVGGLVAARVAGPTDRVTGALHGAVLWGLTTVVGILAVGMLLSTVVSGIARLGGAAAQVVPQAAGALGISADDLLGPVNQRLQAQGKPPVNAQQLQGALSAAASTSLQQGRFDKNTFATALSQQTQMSQADAQDVANQVEQRIGSLGQGAQGGALQAAEKTGKAFFGVFLALLLGLVSAMLGATAGVSQKQRAALGRPAVAAPTVERPERAPV